MIFDKQRLVYEFIASDVETDDRESSKEKIYKLFKMVIPFSAINAINIDKENTALKILVNTKPFLFLFGDESNKFEFVNSEVSANSMPLVTDYCYHGVHILELRSLSELNELKNRLLNFTTEKVINFF